MARLHVIAGVSGLFLLATGGLFSSPIAGLWSDRASAIAACLLLALSISRRPAAGAGILLSLLALAILSTFHTYTASNSTEHLAQALSYVIAAVAFAAGTLRRSDELDRRAVLVGGVFLIALAFYQRWVLFPWLAPQLTGEGHARLLVGRVFSAYMLPAQFSAYLAMILPLALVSLTRRTSRTFEILMVSAIGVAMVLTGSVSGFVAALFALAITFAPSTFAHSRRRAGLGLVLILVLCIAATMVLRRNEFQSTDNPVSMRLQTWRATVHGALERPMLGHGTGSFDQLYLERYWIAGADQVRHPHSWAVLVLFEHGLIGFLLWAGVASGLFRPIRERSWRAAAVAFFVASLLDVADLSMTLRALGLFCLGASLPSRDPLPASPVDKNQTEPSIADC